MQPGDVESTFANIDAIANLTGFKPKTSIEEGINKFVEWYKIFHNC
jgi:UDP-glucuronate 4-epimerase